MDSDQPFPLFKGPLDPGYTRWRNASCVVATSGHASDWGIQTILLSPAADAGAQMGLRVGWQDTPCPRCGEFNLWPADFAYQDAAVCFDCLNDGRAVDLTQF